MLISMPAGAFADMYDRRIVVLVSLWIAVISSVALTAFDLLGLTAPNLLLALCFMVGSGKALMWPAWQSSVSKQVSAKTLPAAVALNGISFNIARSFGPAIGGIAIAGAVGAFAFNALFYILRTMVLLLWRPVAEPSDRPARS